MSRSRPFLCFFFLVSGGSWAATPSEVFIWVWKTMHLLMWKLYYTIYTKPNSHIITPNNILNNHSAAYLCVHLLPFNLGESHAGEVHCIWTQTTNLFFLYLIMISLKLWNKNNIFNWKSEKIRSLFQLDSLTFLFNLGLPRLGGGHDSCSGLCDATGRLLQTVQVGAVFVCFYLERENSNKARDVRSTTR